MKKGMLLACFIPFFLFYTVPKISVNINPTGMAAHFAKL